MTDTPKMKLPVHAEPVHEGLSTAGLPSPVPARAAFTGDHPDRDRSVLERYLSVVAGDDEVIATPPGATGGLHWNVEDNQVCDVMTRQVVSVQVDTPFKNIVDVLATHRIGAVPVVDEHRQVVGVVSESDLLAKVAALGEPAHGRGAKAAHSQVMTKSLAETAGELMTEPAVTIGSQAPIIEAARLAAAAHLRRLPVVDEEGRLIGIVSRADLLLVFRPGDQQIRHHVRQDVVAKGFGIDPLVIDVAVHNGVVTLKGQVEHRGIVGPLVESVRTVAGVVAVHSELQFRTDDSAPALDFPLRFPTRAARDAAAG